MQLVKNLFLGPEKTLSRKLQEIVIAWLLEKELSKDRMMEIYLNIIEWGRGIYGVKHASDFYFDGLPPEHLGPAQAAFLASFIPYPRPFYSKFKKGMKDGDRDAGWERWWSKRLKRVKWILRNMRSNCSSIHRKCPEYRADYCRALHAFCSDPAGELSSAEYMDTLDVLFVQALEDEEELIPDVMEF